MQRYDVGQGEIFLASWLKKKICVHVLGVFSASAAWPRSFGKVFLISSRSETTKCGSKGLESSVFTRHPRNRVDVWLLIFPPPSLSCSSFN